MADGRHLKNRYRVYLRLWWSNLDKIQQSDAKSDATGGNKIRIETGSRIPIWRPEVFLT